MKINTTRNWWKRSFIIKWIKLLFFRKPLATANQMKAHQLHNRYFQCLQN
jgi:hypothetical protein